MGQATKANRKGVTDEKLLRVKAWCFDNGITFDDLDGAWKNALNADVMNVKLANKQGYDWKIFNEIIWSQLLERYGNGHKE